MIFKTHLEIIEIILKSLLKRHKYKKFVYFWSSASYTSEGEKKTTNELTLNIELKGESLGTHTWFENALPMSKGEDWEFFFFFFKHSARGWTLNIRMLCYRLHVAAPRISLSWPESIITADTRKVRSAKSKPFPPLHIHTYTYAQPLSMGIYNSYHARFFSPFRRNLFGVYACVRVYVRARIQSARAREYLGI